MFFFFRLEFCGHYGSITNNKCMHLHLYLRKKHHLLITFIILIPFEVFACVSVYRVRVGSNNEIICGCGLSMVVKM